MTETSEERLIRHIKRCPIEKFFMGFDPFGYPILAFRHEMYLIPFGSEDIETKRTENLERFSVNVTDDKFTGSGWTKDEVVAELRSWYERRISNE
jgi:hypothetical protein